MQNTNTNDVVLDLYNSILHKIKNNKKFSHTITKKIIQYQKLNARLDKNLAKS